MEAKIALYLVDNAGKIIEAITVKKPKSFNELIDIVKAYMKKLPNYYSYFYQVNNEKIVVNSEETYKQVKTVLFIREVKNIKESIFSSNYNKLSYTKQRTIDDKFNCHICEDNIKDIENDKPLICYQCQRLFHRKCLERWNEECIAKNKKLNCPICKFELPLDEWKEKVNYEDERKNEANIMKELNQNKFEQNMTNNINMITMTKYNDLKKIYANNIVNNNNIYTAIVNKIRETNLLMYNNNNQIIKGFGSSIGIYNQIILNLKAIENMAISQLNNNNISLTGSNCLGKK